MKLDKLSNIALFGFITVTITIVFSIFIFSKISNQDNVVFAPKDYQQISNTWLINNTEKVSLPAALSIPSSGYLEMSCIIPDDVNDDKSIMYTSCFAVQKVYVDNELIYTYAENPTMPFGNMRGNAYVVVPLKESYRGKILTIKMQNTLSGDMTSEFPGVYYGTRGDLIFKLLSKNIWRLAYFLCFASIALFSMLFGLAQIFATKNYRSLSFIYFSLLAISVGTWVASDSGITQFFTNESTVCQYLAFTCLISIGCFYMGLCSCLFENQKNFFQVLEIAGFIIYLVMLILYVLDICDPIGFMYVIYIYAFIYMFVSFIVIIRHVKEYEHAFYMIIGTVILIVGVSGGIYSFLNNPVESRSVIWFSVAYGLYTIVLFVVMMRDEQNTLKKSSQASMYEALAFSDKLTGLGNRAAFERAIDNIYSITEGSHDITLFMGDLNYLKKTNDEDGHESGDNLIKLAAKCMNEAFGYEGECFRIGGDEFSCLLIDAKHNSSYYYDRLNDAIDNTLKEQGITISIAMAHANCRFPDDDKNISRDLYREADQKMYNAKLKMKANRE